MRKTTGIGSKFGQDRYERESGSRVSFSLSHVASLGLVFVLLVGFTIILYQIKVEPLGWLIPVVVVASIVPIVLIVLHLVGLPFPFWVSYLGSSSAAADARAAEGEGVEDRYEEDDYYDDDYRQEEYEESPERTAGRSAGVGAGYDYGKGLGARNTSARNLTTPKMPKPTPTPKGAGTVSGKGSAPVPEATPGGGKPKFRTPTRIYMVNRTALAPDERNHTLLDIVTQEATRHCLERYLPDGDSDGGSASTAADTNTTNQPDAKRHHTDFGPTL
jgi:hypothetical protein